MVNSKYIDYVLGYAMLAEAAIAANDTANKMHRDDGDTRKWHQKHTLTNKQLKARKKNRNAKKARRKNR